MPSGLMKKWNGEKGFGFIGPDEGGDDIFCHVSDLLDGEGSVAEGDEVKYKVKYDDRKGKDRAADVETTKKGSGGGGRGRDNSRSRSRGRNDSRGRGRSPPRRGGGGGGGGGGGKRGGGGGGKEETGIMARWNVEKGFGFIKPDSGGDDMFCHVSGLADGDGSVTDGDKVSYRLEFNDRKNKDQAVDVKVTGGGGGGGGGKRGGGGGRGRDRSPSRSPSGRGSPSPARGRGRARSESCSASPPPRRGGRRDDPSPPPRRGGRRDDR